jgi:Superfamily II helicase
MLFDDLSKDVVKDEYFLSLYKRLSKDVSNYIFKESYQETLLQNKGMLHLLRFSDILSNSKIEEYRNLAYKIVSLLSTKYSANPIYKTYSVAILNELGNFPAINYLNYDLDLPFERSLNMEIKKEIHKVPGDNEKVFTDSQYNLFKQLKNSNMYSFSGPTSMGKSFMMKVFISDILINKGLGNFCIIVPTRALISQFSLELNKELKELIKSKNYSIVTSSNVSELSINVNSNSIFIFTPERLINYLSDDKNPKIDYLFVDEAHKLAVKNDSRSITLYVSIDRCIRKYRNIKVYFASPNVSNPEIFLKLFGKDIKNSFRTTESPVTQNLYFIDLRYKNITFKNKYISYDFKPTLLEKVTTSDSLIYNLGNGYSNIIYCSSVHKAINKARCFVIHIQDKDITFSDKEKDEIKKAIRIIKDFIHKDYYLIDCLKRGVAYHFGNLPYIVRNKIEELFKKGIIKYLFCTSTLLEGVNLPAKNIFILSNKKGKSKMEKIDFWNLAGRAGRLNYELYGNIFCVKENDKDWPDMLMLDNNEKIKLESDIVTQTNKNIENIKLLLTENENKAKTLIEKEMLNYITNIIKIDSLDVNDSSLIEDLISNKHEEVVKIAKEKMKDISIPMDILKNNKFVMVQQQDKVYRHIKSRLDMGRNVIYPNQVNYDNSLKVLSRFYELYDWEVTESKLKHIKSLEYYSMLMNKWINDVSLKEIIHDGIEYAQQHKTKIYVYRNDKRVEEIFNINDRLHVNAKINNIIEEIEKVLRYTLEKYFEHYYSILCSLVGEEEAGANWSSFLEYGTRNTLKIALQNLGFSRHASNYIYKNHFDCLEIENNRLININKKKLLKTIDREDSLIIYDEIINIL